MIVACGIDWETATLAERERCASGAGRFDDVVAAAAALPGVCGCVLLGTCNRFEWYAETRDDASSRDVAAALMALVGLDGDAASLFLLEGPAAVSRLMEIASGIRSQILGEDQIISQVRNAQKRSREAHVMTPALETLFRMAVTAGKAVRSRVRFHAVPVSSAHKAVELSSLHLGGVAGRRALVIGNGEMGRLAAELFVRAGAQTSITLRSYRHGETTVPAGCSTVAYEDRANAIAGCDVLISATKSPHCTVTKSMLAGLERRPEIIVDMAIPRDVEPECREFDDVVLFDMDDLRDEAPASDDPQIVQARSIIERYVCDFGDWQRNRALRLAGGKVSRRIAVFAGTVEGRVLCERLSAAGVAAKAFVATEYGRALIADLPHIEVSARRLDEAAMRKELHSFDVVVDATHPYAAEVSRNIAAAAEACGVRRIRLLRPREEFDGEVTTLPDAASAARFLASREGGVFLTCGSKELSVYASIDELKDRLVARVLPSAKVLAGCAEIGLAPNQVIAMQGPFSYELNLAMFKESGARWMVTKDTGSAGGFLDKVEAAQACGMRVVVVSRPVEHEEGVSVEEACRILGVRDDAGGSLGAENGRGRQAAAAFDSRALSGRADEFPYARFPLFVDVSDAPCVVIGAGPVGLRRARALARFGARVSVIAPDAVEGIEGVHVVKRPYRPGDVRGAFCAVAATSDRAVNHAIAQECAQEGVPVSVSDCPEECTFFFPALCESDDLIAGVVSRGNRHALTARAAKAIRRTLQEVDR